MWRRQEMFSQLALPAIPLTPSGSAKERSNQRHAPLQVTPEPLGRPIACT
jgi:hypothetical protein